MGGEDKEEMHKARRLELAKAKAQKRSPAAMKRRAEKRAAVTPAVPGSATAGGAGAAPVATTSVDKATRRRKPDDDDDDDDDLAKKKSRKPDDADRAKKKQRAILRSTGDPVTDAKEESGPPHTVDESLAQHPGSSTEEEESEEEESEVADSEVDASALARPRVYVPSFYANDGATATKKPEAKEKKKKKKKKKKAPAEKAAPAEKVMAWGPQADVARVAENEGLRAAFKANPGAMKASDRVRAELLLARDERKRVKREVAKKRAAKKSEWLKKKKTGRVATSGRLK